MIPNEMTETPDDSSNESQEKISRELLMQMTSRLIRILHKRTTSRRFKPSGHDSPRLQYARTTVAAIQAYTALLRDDEIETLKRRIESLERLRGKEGRELL
jgi:hypothetical protein